MKHFLLTALAATTMLTTPLAAQAGSPVDAAGAGALRTLLQTGLNEQLANLKLQGLATTTTGDFKVEPKGTYYQVTYPALTFTSTDTDPKKQGMIDFGTLTLNAMPGDKDKQWKITAAIPSPIRFKDATGKGTLDLSFGTQKIAAVIDENYGMPMMLDAALGDIALKAPDQPGRMTIGTISAKINYKEDAPGIWSGPTHISLSNLSVKDAKKDTGEMMDFSIGGVSITGDVQKMNMQMVSDYRTKMSELGAAGFDADKGVSPQAMGALWKIVMDHGLQQADSFNADVAINNVSMTEKKADGAPPTAFSLGSAGYGFHMSGLQGDKADGGLSFKFADLSPTGVPADVADYVPQNMNIDLGFKSLPMKQLMQSLGQLAQQGVALEGNGENQNAQMMAMQAMMTVPALLSQAGTVFTVNNTTISNADYGLNLNGTFNADQKAIYGGTGALKAVFSGLDQLVAGLQAKAQKPGLDAALAPKLMQMAQTLTVLQMMGQQGTDAAGKPARTYDLAVDAAGKTTLNGADMQTLMGGGAAANAEAKSAPPASGAQ